MAQQIQRSYQQVQQIQEAIARQQKSKQFLQNNIKKQEHTEETYQKTQGQLNRNKMNNSQRKS